MALRSQNTMQEVCTSMLNLISQAKMMPDADLEWLTRMETEVLEKGRQPVNAMAGQPTNTGPVPGMGPGSAPPMPPPMPPGGAMGPGLMPPPGMGGPGGGPGGGPRPPIPAGLMMGAGTPNMDEMRRLVT